MCEPKIGVTVVGLEILALFDQLHQQGKTLVVITHDHSVASRAQRTVEVKDGQLVSDTLLTEA